MSVGTLGITSLLVFSSSINIILSSFVSFNNFAAADVTLEQPISERRGQDVGAHGRRGGRALGRLRRRYCPLFLVLTGVVREGQLRRPAEAEGEGPGECLT